MMSNPIDDLMMAEATLDLLRLACEKDFAGDRFECKQESAAYAATYALQLVRNARLSYAEHLAKAVSSRSKR